MFGTKSKREIHASGMNSTSTMSSVSQKIDDLQTIVDDEQQANAAAGVVAQHEGLQNVIGKGTVILGNVQAEGDMVVEGVVKGDVTTKTKLVVGPSAIIEGNILAQHAEIAGRVQGTVRALGLLVINSSGMILGDVITKDLNVESGSTFNGRLQVGGNVTSAPIEIAKVTAAPVAAVVATDSVFESFLPKNSNFAAAETLDDSAKTAEQLEANLTKSALLR